MGTRKMWRLSRVAAAILLAAVASGCAGAPSPYSRNLATNGLIWGTVGAGTGYGLAVATKGDRPQSAIIGGIAGAFAGMAGTPYPVAGAPVPPAYSPGRQGFASPYQQGYAEEIERLRARDYYRWVATQREQGRNDARYDYHGR